ncbi:MAG: tetratricopeptide repeat protein [Halothiobacillus sp.]
MPRTGLLISCSAPRSLADRLWLLALLLAALLVYWPGLAGGFVFDDFGNLVDNAAFAPGAVRAHFWAAVWSSGSGPTDRPISMFTFAVQDGFTGLAPWPLKFVNVLIHAANGLLIYLLTRAVLGWVWARGLPTPPPPPLPHKGGGALMPTFQPQPLPHEGGGALIPPPQPSPMKGEGVNAPLTCCTVAPKGTLLAPPPLWGRGWGGGAGAQSWLIAPNTLALLITAAWLFSPMQLTAVLYVIQRMESLASLFMLAGLWLYWQGRMRLIHGQTGGWWRILAGLLGGTVLAVFAKESGVMLPVYAFLLEWLVLRGRVATGFEPKFILVFALVLVLPGIAGLMYTLPGVLNGTAYASRPFDLAQRLWTEGRVLLDYVHWIIAPTPNALSLYHDDIALSTGWFAPWTTAASWAVIAALMGAALKLRRRAPLFALGVLWFFAGHALVSTYIPLELVYEHRNYLPSWGVFIALFGLLFAWTPKDAERRALMRTLTVSGVVALIALYAGFTALRAHIWGNPYRLAYFESTTHPDSPRASYELARVMMIMAPGTDSPMFQMGFSQMENTAKIPGASIQADQALIFMAAKNNLPVQTAWWNNLRVKIARQPMSAEDVSALYSLINCGTNGVCKYTAQDITELGQTLQFAVTRHPKDPGILTLLANYSANISHDFPLAYTLMQQAVALDPKKFDYWKNLVTLQTAAGKLSDARVGIERMRELNGKGVYDAAIAEAQAALVKKEAEVGR